MATYSAIVEWTNSGPDFGAGKYGRGHHWTFDGGAVVPASSSPHVVPAPWADPAGVDPEEALVAAASSCHMLWFLHLARDAGLVVERYFDAAEGVMGRDVRGKISMTRITLRPEIRFSGRTPNTAEIEALHHEAHERCFVASSLLTEIIVAPSTPTP